MISYRSRSMVVLESLTSRCRQSAPNCNLDCSPVTHHLGCQKHGLADPPGGQEHGLADLQGGQAHGLADSPSGQEHGLADSPGGQELGLADSRFCQDHGLADSTKSFLCRCSGSQMVFRPISFQLHQVRSNSFQLQCFWSR